MTDAEFEDLFRKLSMYLRRKVVHSLLCGNDTCCFTTQQYIDAWRRERNHAVDGMGMELAKKHLRSVPSMVREVRPGVWAASSETALKKVAES